MCQPPLPHQPAFSEWFASRLEHSAESVPNRKQVARDEPALFYIPHLTEEKKEEDYFDPLFVSPLLEGDARRSSSFCEQIAKSFFSSQTVSLTTEESDAMKFFDLSLLPSLFDQQGDDGEIPGEMEVQSIEPYKHQERIENTRAIPKSVEPSTTFPDDQQGDDGETPGEMEVQSIELYKHRERIEHIRAAPKSVAPSTTFPESSLQSHVEYLTERLNEDPFVPDAHLFKEMKARGYRQSRRQAHAALRAMRWKIVPSQTYLPFHMHYLIKRLEKTPPPSNICLFKEIKARGYRGSAKQLERVLYKLRKGEHCIEEDVSSPESSLYFHQNYLIEKVKQTESLMMNRCELFEELKARGYRGSLRHLQEFLVAIRPELIPPESYLGFHKNYLIERLKGETISNYISGRKLFEEIRARGYRGSLGNVQGLLAAIRKERRLPRAFLDFHKKYLLGRFKEMQTDHIGKSATTLFKEIREQGYRGPLIDVKIFLMRAAKKPPQIDLDFHKNYLIERVQKGGMEAPSGPELFREIREKGYLGGLRNVQRFLATVRKDKPPSKAGVSFHEHYLCKRLLETQIRTVPKRVLFQEICARGYRGSVGNFCKFLRKLSMRIRRRPPIERVAARQQMGASQAE